MPKELSEGTMIGEYRVKGVLGQGGFGLTYLAYDESLDRDVAIKEYFPREFAHRDAGRTIIPNQDEQDRADFEWGMKHFVEEARSLTRFRHKNIVGAIRFIRENGTAYLVMEYCDGESLEAMVKKAGSLPPHVLMPIVSQLLDGLDEVHRARLLHLDVKPSNIFVKKDGTVVLLDFGSARQAISSHTKSVKIASAGYGAIEQESADIDSGKLGPWTDVYGLGATLYRLITGSRPQQATARLFQDTMPALSSFAERGYSAGLINAVSSAISIKPQDRPQSIAEFRTLLSHVSSIPAGSTSENTSLRDDPSLKDSWTPWAPLLVVLGFVAFVVFWVNRSGEDPPTDDPPPLALPGEEPYSNPADPPPEGPGVTRCPPGGVWTDCYGEFKSDNGDVYRGLWMGNQRHGRGEEKRTDGVRYVGDFRKDLWHGQGEIFWLNGDRYVGRFQNGLRDGQGTYYWPDGSKHVGLWRANKRQGYGVEYAPNGRVVVSGNWTDDKPPTDSIPSEPDTGSSPGAQVKNLYIDVANNTGYRIDYLYVRYAGTSSRGSDRLGQATLSSGSKFKVDLPRSESEIFDVIACDVDGDEYIVQNVNALTSDAVITFDSRTYSKCRSN